MYIYNIEQELLLVLHKSVSTEQQVRMELEYNDTHEEFDNNHNYNNSHKLELYDQALQLQKM